MHFPAKMAPVVLFHVTAAGGFVAVGGTGVLVAAGGAEVFVAVAAGGLVAPGVGDVVLKPSS